MIPQIRNVVTLAMILTVETARIDSVDAPRLDLALRRELPDLFAASGAEQGHGMIFEYTLWRR